MAIVPVNAPTPTLTPVTINASPGDQTDPHVSGDWAAYTDGTAIRYYNFATTLDTQIPLAGSGADSLSDVSGSKIVFSRYFPGSRIGVMVYDATTPSVAPIELNPTIGSNRPTSAIGNNTVAFIDLVLDGNGELVIHDLATSIGNRITFDTAYDQNPMVSPDGNTVVWEHCSSDSLNCDIWQAHRVITSWTISTPANTSAPEANPDSNGSTVVYESLRGGNRDIFWQPVAGGPETQLQLPGFERNPSIASTFVAFESSTVDGGAADLFAYDIATNRLYQLTNTPASEQLNDITVLVDGRVRLVWATDETGVTSRNVKGVTFTPAPSDVTAPVLTMPAGMMVNAATPAGAVVSFSPTATDDVTLSPTITCLPASGSTFAIGTTTVTCTATDAAGNHASGSFSIVVLGASAQIADLVDKTRAYLGLPALPPLIRARLQAAADALVAGNHVAACAALQLYVVLVNAIPAPILTAAQKVDLLADVARIRSVIGC